MDAPKYQQPAPDLAFAELQQQGQQQDIAAIQDKTKVDTASILARYGANLALAGTAGTGGAPMSGLPFSAKVA